MVFNITSFPLYFLCPKAPHLDYIFQ